MKFSNKTLLLMLVAGAVFISGCSRVQEYEDVSSDPAYHGYIGADYTTLVDMHFSGVNLPPGYGETVDMYKLGPTLPSWGGRELITRETLPIGTIFQVESVQRCTNCLSEKLIKAHIQIPNHPTEFDRPIYIHLQYLAPEFVRRLNEPNK